MTRLFFQPITFAKTFRKPQGGYESKILNMWEDSKYGLGCGDDSSVPGSNPAVC